MCLDSVVDIFLSDNSNYKYFINVNERMLLDDFFVEKIINLQKNNSDFVNRIGFEISEKINLFNNSKLIENIMRIHNLGYLLSLDDYFSPESMVYPLLMLPLEYIKIDKNFILDFLNDERKINLIKTIISYCKVSDIDLIAEGIEDSKTFEILLGLGVPMFQGFLFSKALSKNEILFLTKKLG